MRLHVVDGTWELFRAYFSKRPDHVTPDGRPYKAVAGLASSLLALLHDPAEAVTHVAVAFDRPIESFRNDLYDGYKTGAGMPEDLFAQMVPAEEAVRAMGGVVWVCDRWEADDALATAAVRFAGEVEQVRILSPDKDQGQVLRGTRIVQVNRLTEKVIDEDALRAWRGVGPGSIADLLALIGDSADGIPGLPGWGEKSAAAVLARYGTIEAVPDDPAAWDVKVRGADRLAATLAANRGDAMLFKKLATLWTDVPLAESLEDLRWKGVPRAAWGDFCARGGLRGLAARPSRWAE
ncbi:MAG: 5'-3' exonuclease [Myxococcota bacterium]